MNSTVFRDTHQYPASVFRVDEVRYGKCGTDMGKEDLHWTQCPSNSKENSVKEMFAPTKGDTSDISSINVRWEMNNIQFLIRICDYLYVPLLVIISGIHPSPNIMVLLHKQIWVTSLG